MSEIEDFVETLYLQAVCDTSIAGTTGFTYMDSCRIYIPYARSTQSEAAEFKE